MFTRLLFPPRFPFRSPSRMRTCANRIGRASMVSTFALTCLVLALTLIGVSCPALGALPIEPASPNQAETSPDGASPALPSPACRILDATLEAMLAEVAHCQANAEFLAQLGYLLNAQGRYNEALDHLERALLLDPRLKGAQIDYAIALAGSGDNVSALTLVRNLLADPTLPSALAPILRRQIDTMSALQGSRAATPDARLLVRGTAGVHVGYATNPLGSPNLSSLILTFPGLPVELPLDGSYLSRPGSYGRADASLSMRYDAGADVKYEFFGGVQEFRSVLAESSKSQQIEFAVERIARQNSIANGFSTAAFYQGLSIIGVRTAADVRYQAQILAAGVELPGLPGWQILSRDPNAANCRTRLGFEVANRQLSNNRLLSGLYGGVTGQWRCYPAGGGYWQLGAVAGRDQVRQEARPGGDQFQYAARASRLWPNHQWAPASLKWAGNLQIVGAVTGTRDSTSYSALLDSGRVRHINQFNVRAELQQQMDSRWLLVWGVDWFQQRANLRLFTFANAGPYVALRTAW